jgi:uncharacterized protein
MGRIGFFLLLALAVYVGWLWLRRASPGSQAARRGATAAPQAMVSCAHCGLHVPQADALPAGDHYFCCEDHRRRGPAS